MLDHVATTNDDRVGPNRAPDLPGSLLAGLDRRDWDCDCGGPSWHQTPKPTIKANPHFLLFWSLGLREEELDVVSVGAQPNPATTAALICSSCLTVSVITIMSRLLHILKSAELTSDFGLLAQKFTSQGTAPSHHAIPDDAVLSCFAYALSRHFGDLPALPSLMLHALGPNESEGAPSW